MVINVVIYNYVEQDIYIYVHEFTHEHGASISDKTTTNKHGRYIARFNSLFTNHSFLQILLLLKISVKMKTLSLKRHRIHIKVSR